MNRTGLIIALAIAAVAGLVFGLYPQLDLAISAPLNAMMLNGNNFGARIDPSILLARSAGLWVPALLVAPAVVALVLKLILPKRKMLVPGRAVIFLIATLALAPGLFTNVLLKDHWGRPRPIDVTQFGGALQFVPWWDPRGACPTNCSFVSGDVAATFWTVAPVALAPPHWRALAYGAALALGAGMAVIRMMAGAHFASDVIFAGVFTFLIIWIVHGLIYRWPRTRLSDEAIERDIEAVGNTRYRLMKRMSGGKDRTAG